MIALLSDRWFPYTLGVVIGAASVAGLSVGALFAGRMNLRPVRLPTEWGAMD